MAGDWRYIASRLNGDGTETFLDTEVPLKGVSLTKAVSGTPSMQASISPALARLVGLDGQPVLQQWSTAIYAEADGEIRHGCILSNVSKNGPELSLSGVGFTGIIKDQPYTGSTFFVERDALDIGRHIWDHWQSFPGGNVGLVLDRTTKTGQKVGTTLRQAEFDSQNGPMTFEAGPYKLNEWETTDLGGKFASLGTDYGFDWAESHAWDGEQIAHRLDFGVPRIGTRRADLRFVLGENVFPVPSVDASGDDYASAVLILGAGQGASMNRSLVTRAGEKRLRRIARFTDNTLKSNTATALRGRQYLPLLAGQPEVSSFTVVDHAHAPLGSWREGDEVEIAVDGEWGDDVMWVRILSTTITPEAAGVATVSVVRADKIPS